jgi:hypothetical protein
MTLAKRLRSGEMTATSPRADYRAVVVLAQEICSCDISTGVGKPHLRPAFILTAILLISMIHP